MNQEMEGAVESYCMHIKMLLPKSETAKHYASDLNQFMQVIDKAPTEINNNDISQFVTSQLESNRSGATINRRLATLSSFFDYQYEINPDSERPNPVCWRIHRIETGYHLPKDLPERVVRQLWESIRKGQIRDQVMLGLMLDVGLRVGEVAALKMDDIESSEREGQLWSLRLKGKGNKERRVWLTPETAEQLSSYLSERVDSSVPHLFLTRRHKGISVRGIQERLDFYREKAGLSKEEVSCHRLRHTFARRMAEARMPLPSLSHWLGHSDLKTTQIYIDGANPDIRDDYEEAMEHLSRQAMAPALEPVRSEGKSTSPMLSEYQPPNATGCIRLSGDEIRQRLDPLPLWLHQPIVSFLLHQQMRWKTQYQRRRTQQWLGELVRGWLWMLDQRPISSLSELHRTDLQDYLHHLGDLELATNTVNHFINTFKSFLRFVEDSGESVSPAFHRFQRLKREHSLPRPLTEAEFAQLEHIILTTTAMNHSPIDQLHRTWFLILADAGLRIGELVALALSDWYPETRTLFIRDAKHHRDRRLPITERAADAINTHLLLRTDDPRPHSPLLLRDGSLLTPNYVRTHLRAFADLVNLSGVTPHRLRHTFATRLLNSGRMPITTLQKLMGHTHIDTTMLYVQLYDTTIQKHYLAAMATQPVDEIPEPKQVVRDVLGDLVITKTIHKMSKP